MIGIGCGARSYTSSLHYSTEYAVGRSSVKSILADYIQREPDDFQVAQYGHRLAPDDRRRRFVIQSLLQSAGLHRADFRQQFDRDVLEFLPELNQLPQHDLGSISSERIQLNSDGLAYSDAIGPWLYSSKARSLSREFVLQ